MPMKAHQSAVVIGRKREVKPEDLSTDGWLYKAMLADDQRIKDLEKRVRELEVEVEQAQREELDLRARLLCDVCGAVSHQHRCETC